MRTVVKGLLGVFACQGKESGVGRWEWVRAQGRKGGWAGQEGGTQLRDLSCHTARAHGAGGPAEGGSGDTVRTGLLL